MPPPYPSTFLVGATNQKQAIEVSNSRDPAGQPITLPFVFDFSLQAMFNVDLIPFFQQGKIDNIQTLYADNSLNAKEIVVVIAGSNQRIVVPQAACCYLPVLVPENASLSFSSPGNVQAIIELINVPMPTAIWYPYDAHTHG